MIFCNKCGLQFDPAKQAAFCRGRGDPLKHHPVKQVENYRPPADFEPACPKQKRRAEFQSDFRLLWDGDK